MSIRELNSPVSPEDEEEERKNFLTVIAAFKNYRLYSLNRVQRTEIYLNSLPDAHQEMLSEYRVHLKRIRDCVDINFHVICKMIQNFDQLFDDSTKIKKQEDGHTVKARHNDLHVPIETFKSIKVQVTLKQFARDWSLEGEEERQQCYKPIIEEILNYYDPNEIDTENIKVLVPGAGLGRLTYEIACLGYYCEGNEFSLFMLIASNFVLNKCETENQYTIYPWVHQFVNNVRQSDQVIPVTFPDVSPVKERPKGAFTMAAGDFLQVYTQSDYWDCVATCFFIDCANNVVQFIETIYKILKPGAIWVNLGPLLYHYSDIHNELSIEPTYEDLIRIIKAVGFEILRNETGIRTKYAQNPRSMQQSEYLSLFCVCRKPNNNDEVNNGDVNN